MNLKNWLTAQFHLGWRGKELSCSNIMKSQRKNIGESRILNFPKVSIVIPVMNGENFLAEAIESALTQDYPNFEVLIGVNPSSDQTLKIAKSFNNNKSVRVFEFQTVVNMPANFNRVGLHASGKYLRFLCHDDLLVSDSTRNLVQALEVYSSANFAVGFEGFIGIERRIRDQSSLGSKEIVSGERVIRRAIRYGNWIGGPSSVMIRNSEFQSQQFSEELSCSFDLDYWCHLATHGNLAVAQSLSIFSRNHSDQASNQCVQGGFDRDNAKILAKIKKSNATSSLNKLFIKLFSDRN